MTYEQIEKAAQQYAQRLVNEYDQDIPELSLCDLKFDCQNAFIQGAQVALQNQWVSVEERLPEEQEEVLCRMKSNGAVVSGFIFINKKGIPQVATDSCFHFEDYKGYEPTHWMPLPPLNPEK